jgi:hypothetical protein
MAFKNVFPKNKILFRAIIAFIGLPALIYTWTLVHSNLMSEETFIRIGNTIKVLKSGHFYTF